jgi:ribosomal protein S18 acetylase RimI-like enzyme
MTTNDYSRTAEPYRIRAATELDLHQLIDLDLLCFPSGQPGVEQASEGEIERGIRDSTMLIIEKDQQILGFLQYHIVREHELGVFLSGLAVDPSARRRGLATHLVEDFLDKMKFPPYANAILSTSVDPANHPMLRLLTSHGFVGETLIDNYFGPGKDRLICRHRVTPEMLISDDLLFMPVHNQLELKMRLDREDWMLAGVRDFPNGAMYEMRRYSLTDRASVMSTECTVSVTFASVIIGALAFLTGFGMVRSGFPPDLLSQLIIALIVSTIGLVIYANASGELSAFHYERFSEYMEWGNVLTEFGGVYPILQIVPVAVTSITHRESLGGITCVAASIGAALYQASPFDILDRYNNNRFLFLAAAVLLIISPVVGFVCQWQLNSTALWSIGNVLLLAGVALLCATRIGTIDVGKRPDRHNLDVDGKSTD